MDGITLSDEHFNPINSISIFILCMYTTCTEPTFTNTL